MAFEAASNRIETPARGEPTAVPAAPISVDGPKRALGTALASRDAEAIRRAAHRYACLATDDPTLPLATTALIHVDDQNLLIAFTRMAQILDPANPTRRQERVHRAAKAGRPDMMPPHWMRDVVRETRDLKALLTAGDLPGAKAFVERPDLVGLQRYMPEFRALLHFVRYNTDPEYRATFDRIGLRMVTAIDPLEAPKCSRTTGGASGDEDPNRTVLDALIETADWREARDIVLSTDGLPGYSDHKEKRLRIGDIRTADIPRRIQRWTRRVHEACATYWDDLIQHGLTRLLFGISPERAAQPHFEIRFRINEILSGPVFGPHFHSGTQSYDKMAFPFISAIFYPETVPENAGTNAGHLEVGRPDFPVPFEPVCRSFRPIAGRLVVLPAFAYHGVVPIDRGPRYSVPIDFFVFPTAHEPLSIEGFFT